MVTRRSSGPTGYYDRSDAYENLRSGVLIYYPGDLDIAPRRGGERFDVRRRKTTESQAGPKIFLNRRYQRHGRPRFIVAGLAASGLSDRRAGTTTFLRVSFLLPGALTAV